ncbi:hypothetical protein [Paenibacillus sp. IITD108]|uniref:hypothetical protein n=1 Tax=Paenibacillus sp. IITD108 TaxID=3116649 RepID=UPI002F404E76
METMLKLVETNSARITSDVVELRAVLKGDGNAADDIIKIKSRIISGRIGLINKVLGCRFAD